MTRLLLTGYAVGSILAALLAMAMYVSGANLRQIFGFLLGGLDGSSWVRLAIAAPLILGASLVIGSRSRALDGLLLGDVAAGNLGIDVRHERRILLAMASLATAAAVADQRADRLRRPGRAARRPAARRVRTRAGCCRWRRSAARACSSWPTSWRGSLGEDPGRAS